MNKQFTNKWNRTQVVEIIKDEGNFTLVKNENNVEFYALTSALKDIK